LSVVKSVISFRVTSFSYTYADYLFVLSTWFISRVFGFICSSNQITREKLLIF